MKGAIYLWKSGDVGLEVRIQRSVLVLEVLFRAQRGTRADREFKVLGFPRYARDVRIYSCES